MSDLVVAKLGRTPYHRAIATGIGSNGIKLGMGDIIGVRAFSSRAGTAVSIVEQFGGE